LARQFRRHAEMMKMVAAVVVPLALAGGAPESVESCAATAKPSRRALGRGSLVGTAALLAVMTPVGQLFPPRPHVVGFGMNAGWGAAMLLASWWMVRWGAEGLAGARLLPISSMPSGRSGSWLSCSGGPRGSRRAPQGG
jgi:hypothetical protein